MAERAEWAEQVKRAAAAADRKGSRWRSARDSREFGDSVRTVSGGLPGQGRR